MSSCEHNLRRVKIRDWLQGYESRFHERLVKRGGGRISDKENEFGRAYSEYRTFYYKAKERIDQGQSIPPGAIQKLEDLKGKDRKSVV